MVSMEREAELKIGVICYLLLHKALDDHSLVNEEVVACHLQKLYTGNIC